MTADPVWDPLGRRTELPFEQEFLPLGFRLVVRTNSPQILKIAAAAFPETEVLDQDASPALLEAIVEGDGHSAEKAPCFRGRGGLISVTADAENCGVIDIDSNRVALWLTAATLRDRERFRREWLEGPVFTLLSERWLVPIHASCAELDGRGALLCGPSGAGKSTLALELAKNGWTFVTDDVAYLLRSDPSVLLGRSRRVRLKRGCAVQFVDPAELGLDSIGRTTPGALLFLDRGPVPAGLQEMGVEDAQRRLRATLPESTAREEQLAALESLRGLPIFQLRYEEADAAAELVEQVLRCSA